MASLPLNELSLPICLHHPFALIKVVKNMLFIGPITQKQKSVLSESSYEGSTAGQSVSKEDSMQRSPIHSSLSYSFLLCYSWHDVFKGVPKYLRIQQFWQLLRSVIFIYLQHKPCELGPSLQDLGLAIEAQLAFMSSQTLLWLAS